MDQATIGLEVTNIKVIDQRHINAKIVVLNLIIGIILPRTFLMQ